MSRRTGRTGRLLAVPLALWAGALAAGCAEEIRSESPEDAVEEHRPAVAVLAPERDGRRVFQTHLYSERDADLYNRLMIEETAGGGIPVTAIHVEVGQPVRQGQLLATLEDDDARLYVEAAQPEAEVAAANLRRIEELRKTGVVSEAEREEALYESLTADAALAQAKLNLSRTEVRAPFEGVVSRRYVRVGDVVDEETPMFRVTAMAPLRARLLVPESEVGDFAVGTPVRLSAGDGAEGTARVIIVGPTIDPGSGTREVIVELAKVESFRPGAAVTAERAAPAADTVPAAPDAADDATTPAESAP